MKKTFVKPSIEITIGTENILTKSVEWNSEWDGILGECSDLYGGNL